VRLPFFGDVEEMQDNDAHERHEWNVLAKRVEVSVCGHANVDGECK
jgi:hypothetical protein